MDKHAKLIEAQPSAQPDRPGAGRLVNFTLACEKPALFSPMLYSPAFIFSSDYSLGLGFLAGLRLLVLRQFSAFLPAVRRLRGAVLFRGLRPSSIQKFLFLLLWLTGQSSRPAFGGRLTFGVSPQENHFIQAHGLFTSTHLLKRLSAGCFAVCRASPSGAASVSSLFGLQRLRSKRHKLSFCKRCAASVAQCFFAVCTRRQVGVSRFGVWV